MPDATEEMEEGAEDPTAAPIGPTAGPSSSKSLRLPRSLFITLEFSNREKCKHRNEKEEEHMARMVDYLTTGVKTELQQYGKFIRDPFDLGIFILHIYKFHIDQI